MSVEERVKLARDPSTSPEELDRLSHDSDEDVRCWVAEHPLTSTETLNRLSHDLEWLVRLQVAGHLSLSHEAFERLSHDPIGSVRWAIALNPMVPVGFLILLVSDEVEGIRDAAWKTIEERGLLGLLNDG